jgi:hypothetical protein
VHNFTFSLRSFNFHLAYIHTHRATLYFTAPSTDVKMSSSNVSVPGEMWVKYSTGQAILVSTLGCEDVAEFISAVKAKLPNELGSIDPHRITLHIHENADSLRPGLRLSLLHEQAGYSGNDDEHTLIVKATGMLDSFFVAVLRPFYNSPR